MSEIYAVLECVGEDLHEQSGELLGELLDIARRRSSPMTVCAVILLPRRGAIPDLKLLEALGIQKLYILEHPELAHYTTEGHVQALTWLLQGRYPLLIAASATPNGCDWMPRFAARQHLPFAPNCLGFDIHEDNLLALRSLYAGKAFAQTHVMLNGRTALATLVPGVRGSPASEQAPVSQLQVIPLQPKFSRLPAQAGVRHLAIQAPSPDEVELEAAERIVAGGRGVGQDGFATLASFAHLLGAAVGATRVATDLGWVEHERQIGATGRIVHPRLYIACGISGAAQHTSGMSEAQTVVAINPDRSAPILSLADLGLLGDANQVLALAATLLEAAHNTEGHE